MELIDALLCKMSELDICSSLVPNRDLRAQAQVLVGLFERKYRSLALESVYGRNLAVDLFQAWGLFIDTQPDIGNPKHPAFVLLIADGDSGYGPFLRWLLKTENDSDCIIVLKAAIEDRVAAFVQHEYLDDWRKRAINRFHRYFRHKSGDEPTIRVRLATCDYFVNERGRQGSGRELTWFWPIMNEHGIFRRQAETIPWLLEYIRMHRELGAAYDAAFAAGRDDAQALFNKWNEFCGMAV